jgi:signal transduction histidine kinase
VTSEVDAALAIETVEALDDATRAIAEVLDLEAVLQLIVDRVRHLGNAEYAALGMVDGNGRIERFITAGISAEQRAAIGPLPEGHGLLGLIIREGRSYRIPDIAAHPDSFHFPPNHPPMHSFLGVPITVHGRPVGDLYLTDKREGEFDATDQRVVELFARHAGVAIENARLHDRVALLAVIEERDRIGRDLHDGIIQSLYAVGLSLEDVDTMMADQPAEAAARVDAAIDAIHVAIGDIRQFILGLRPMLAARHDLVGGLAALVESLRSSTYAELGLELLLVVDAEPGAAYDLDTDATTQLMHIAREALSNVSRHADASRATVELGRDADGVRLVVADDGVGFQPPGQGETDHQGIANMRDRAASIGGSLRIDSAPGAGTRIIVTVPNRPPVEAS